MKVILPNHVGYRVMRHGKENSYLLVHAAKRPNAPKKVGIDSIAKSLTGWPLVMSAKQPLRPQNVRSTVKSLNTPLRITHI